MSDCKIYPADTVDIYGNVCPTVGENIRNGMFGKLKAAKIKIDGKNITSNDLEIVAIYDSVFRLNKNVFFVFIDKLYKGALSIRKEYSPEYCDIFTTYLLENIKADITVLYKEW